MKKTIITLCLTLCAMTVFSQDGKKKIIDPPEPFVIEGNITDVPEGAMVVLYKQATGDTMGWGVDSVKINKGKFHFKVEPDRWDEEYTIGLKYNGRFDDTGRHIFATPGTTTKITGSGVQVAQWNVENDNLYQKEDNTYNKLYKEWIREADEFEKIKNAYGDSLKLTSDRNAIRKLKEWYAKEQNEHRKRDSLNIVMNLEFLEHSKYDAPFAQRLHGAAGLIFFDHDFHNLRYRARLLLYKVPVSEVNKKLIVESLQFLYPKYDKIKPGELMPDIPFYDCDDKEHHFSELYGNGKYKIVEIHGRHFGGFNGWRAKEWLDYLHENYSDKIDLLFFNIDLDVDWVKSAKNKKKNKNCDPWIEWSDHNNGVDLKEIFRSDLHPFAFFSPDGKFLGMRWFFSLKDGIE